MATQDSTTETRTTIAEAINSKITMTDDQALDVAEAVIEALKGEATGRRKMILDLCRGIRKSAKWVDKNLIDEEIGLRMMSIKHATKTIESIIADKSVMPKGQLSALELLAKYDRECAQMSEAKCAKELAGYQYDVHRDLSVTDEMQPGDPYAVSHGWTLKGLRRALAKERFLEEIMFDDDGNERLPTES